MAKLKMLRISKVHLILFLGTGFLTIVKQRLWLVDGFIFMKPKLLAHTAEVECQISNVNLGMTLQTRIEFV
jgi:hypothetical protein